MDLKPLSPSHQTVFSDLIQKALDADFEEQFPLDGTFQVKTTKGRAYWYYASKMEGGERKKTYVGPASDEAISSRVAKFNELKSDYSQRRSIVRSLIAAGLPSPNRTTGDIIEGLSKAGIFRLRGVLVGSAAFQTYAGYLGVKIRNSLVMTMDIDFAQFHSIAVAIDDQMPPMIDTLQMIDKSFNGIMALEGAAATKFRNAEGIDVEFLTPNRGSDSNQGHATNMPALGGAHAEPLRYLDYLIHNPVRSVLLHKAGIAITVPAPERYAIHKLIVSVARHNDQSGSEKSLKDIGQAEALIQALNFGRRSDELGEAWIEAWQRGPAWREKLERGVSRLDHETKSVLRKAIEQACKLTKKPFDNYAGPDTFPSGD